MKLSYTTANGRMTVEFEGTQVEVFKQLSQFQEVFEDITCRTKDGKESSDRVKFQVRNVDGNDFFELVCVDEGKPNLRYAKKQFGQHKSKEQTLFPKGSWVKWDRDKKEEVEI